MNREGCPGWQTPRLVLVDLATKVRGFVLRSLGRMALKKTYLISVRHVDPDLPDIHN